MKYLNLLPVDPQPALFRRNRAGEYAVGGIKLRQVRHRSDISRRLVDRDNLEPLPSRRLMQCAKHAAADAAVAIDCQANGAFHVML
jgi:hypothetical protein